MRHELSNDNQIVMFLHCALCLDERPADVPPKEWARLSVGWTRAGLQVWCARHECNVVNIDFQGKKHPADTTRSAA